MRSVWIVILLQEVIRQVIINGVIQIHSYGKASITMPLCPRIYRGAQSHFCIFIDLNALGSFTCAEVNYNTPIFSKNVTAACKRHSVLLRPTRFEQHLSHARCCFAASFACIMRFVETPLAFACFPSAVRILGVLMMQRSRTTSHCRSSGRPLSDIRTPPNPMYLIIT